jgi:hypothetical protein
MELRYQNTGAISGAVFGAVSDAFCDAIFGAVLIVRREMVCFYESRFGYYR